MKTLVTRRQALAATSALALAQFAANAGELEKFGMQLILAAERWTTASAPAQANIQEEKNS